MRPHSKRAAGGKVLTFRVPMRALGVRSRRVWVYLPPGSGSGKRYPVLYMQDGQNLFDPETSFCGHWGVGESLDALCAEGRTGGAIVVGVDNGGRQRWSEYSPWYNFTERGKGRGAAYAEFLARELKPRIDAELPTLAGREHTGVAGSSYGAGISFYSLLAYPDVFSKAGVFSPAFWAYGRAPLRQLTAAAVPRGTRVYLDVGTDEGDHAGAYVRETQAMAAMLREKRVAHRFVLDRGGKHHESAWAARFPAAFLWLFGGDR